MGRGGGRSSSGHSSGRSSSGRSPGRSYSGRTGGSTCENGNPARNGRSLGTPGMPGHSGASYGGDGYDGESSPELKWMEKVPCVLWVFPPTFILLVGIAVFLSFARAMFFALFGYDMYDKENNIGSGGLIGKGHPVLASCFLVLALLTFGKTAVSGVTPLARETGASTEAIMIDDLGWLTEDKGDEGLSEVEEAMDYFYGETGVRPAIIITESLSDIDGYEEGDGTNDTLEAFYDLNFDDEGHLIFLTLTKDGANDYDTVFIYEGSAAANAIDETDREKMFDIFDKYWYNSPLDECTLYAKLFKESADKLTCRGWKMAGAVFLAISAALFVHFGLMTIKKKKAEQAEEEKGRRERIEKEYDELTKGGTDGTGPLKGKYGG